MLGAMKAKPELAEQFFGALWPDGIPSGSHLILWGPGQDAGRHSSVSGAVESLDNRLPYFGLGLQDSSVAVDSPKQRGGSETVSAIPGFWFDLDCRSADRPDLPSREEALGFIQRLFLSPSLVVDSGGGFHLYWLFKEPWILDSKQERDNAAALSEGWQTYLYGQGTRRRWSLDLTADLARVFRIPGTLNRKELYETPRLVEVVGGSDSRFIPEDFEVFLLEDGPKAPQGVAPTKVSDVPDEIEALIASAGWTVIPKRSKDGSLAWLEIVGPCPICKGEQSTASGAATNTAFLASWGWSLRCQRASCPASKSGGGVPLTVWAKELAGSEYEPPAVDNWFSREVQGNPSISLPFDRSSSRPIAEAPEALREVLQRVHQTVQEERVIVVLAAPLGSGKTHAMLDLIESGVAAAYFAPNHTLLEEFSEKLNKRGVQHNYLKGVERACIFGREFIHADRRSDWRGRACITCPEKATCDAWVVPREGVPLIAPFDLYWSLRHQADSPLADRFVVIDEPGGWTERFTLFSDGLDSLTSPIWHTQDPRRLLVANDLKRILHLASERSASEGHPVRLFGNDLTSFIGDHLRKDFLDSLEQVMSEPDGYWPAPSGEDLRIGKTDPAHWPKPEYRSILSRLSSHLSSNDGASETGPSPELVASSTQAWFELIRPRHIEPYEDRGAVFLDATGYLRLEETRAAHKGIEIRYEPVPLVPTQRPRCLHLPTTAATRGRVLRDGKPTKAGILRLKKEMLKTVQEAQLHLAMPNPRLGVLTHKPLAEYFNNSAKNLDAQIRGTEFGYYGKDDRGTNRFEHVDAFLTFGDPHANPPQAEAEARAIGVDPAALIASKRLVTLCQAQGRSRWTRSPVLLRHVGLTLPPDWGYSLLHFTDTDKGGHPGNLTRNYPRILAVQLCQEGWFPHWPPELLWSHALEPELRHELLSEFSKDPQERKKIAFKNIASTFAKKMGAVSLSIRYPAGGGLIVARIWSLQGLERASLEAATKRYSISVGDLTSEGDGLDPLEIPFGIIPTAVKNYLRVVELHDYTGNLLPHFRGALEGNAERNTFEE